MNSKRSLPPSVTPGIPKLDRFPAAWRRLPFGEVLEPAVRPLKVVPDASYQLVVARRNRGGISPRERLRGDQIKTPSQFEIREGDFVIAKRQIIHGGCGFVPQSLDGAIVSGEYDVFRAKQPLLAGFLRWFTHTAYFQQTCYQCSIGVDVEKMIFQTDRWLRVLLPLPPVDVQLRIARGLNAVEATEVRLELVVGSKSRLKQALLQQLLTGKLRFPGTETVQWGTRRIDEVASINPETLPETTAADYEFRYVELSCVDSGKIALPATMTRFGGAPSRARRLVRSGDLLFSTVRPNLLGFVRVPYLPDPLVASTGFAVVRTTQPADAEFMYQSFYSTPVLRQVDAQITGTSFPAMSAADVGALRVAWPDSELARERIGVLLHRVDTELALLDRQLAAVRKLKRGLMQKLLTGELEVPANVGTEGDEVHA